MPPPHTHTPGREMLPDALLAVVLAPRNPAVRVATQGEFLEHPSGHRATSLRPLSGH